ncbi:MAG: hypothetical protein ACMXX9_04455 [Candidatus Woesearchaeota archaeon]
MEDKPLFIKIEEHSEIKSILNEIKSKIDITKNKIQTLKELKQQEEDFINKWDYDTENIEKKVSQIETILDTAE